MATGHGGTPAPTRPTPPVDRWKAFRDYLHSFEDGALVAGGPLATIAGSLGTSSNPNTSFVIVGLSFAAIHKVVPSLVSNLPSISNEKGENYRWLSVAGDSLLIFFAAFGLLYYCLLASRSLTAFLLFIGVAFMSKAAVAIAHALLRTHASTVGTATVSGGGPTEDLLFLVFGLAAVLLSIPGLGNASETSPALRIAGLGKALPSLLSGGSGGGGKGTGK